MEELEVLRKGFGGFWKGLEKKPLVSGCLGEREIPYLVMFLPWWKRLVRIVYFGYIIS